MSDWRPKIFLWVTGLTAFLVVPGWLPEYVLYQVCLIATTSVVVLGLIVVSGLAGQISLAQAAFVAMGGYGATILANSFGLPIYIGIVVSALGAAGAGYFLGQITLRVSGHYLALATMAFTAIVQLAIVNLDSITGGASGMAVPPMQIGSMELQSGKELYYLIVPVLVLAMVAVYNISQSRIGRAFHAIRQSEIAAAAMGVPVLRYKAAAFAASAFLGGLGGGLLAVLSTYLDPAQFGITQSIYYLAVAVIGGMLSPFGALIGSAVFVLLPELLQAFQSYLGLIFALLLLLFILLRPAGMASLLGAIWRRLKSARGLLGRVSS